MKHGNTINREFERNGFKFEITGASNKVRLWINGALCSLTFTSLRDARRHALNYAERHAA